MQNVANKDTTQADWQRSLQQAITDLPSLCSFLELNQEDEDALKTVCGDFPLLVTREFAGRMKKGDRHDPLLRQILPTVAEAISTPGYSHDPLAEQMQNPVPGLLHKYHGRVLVTLTGKCAIHCRYCFRRHFPYEDNNPGTAGRAQLLAYIANDKSIHEVIFSGGDPLIASDKLLQQFITALSDIKHITTLRIHTRLPIVLPSRITNTLLELLSQTRLQSVLVYHANHANEIDDNVIMQAQRLRAAGVTLLNQSVLLANINDDATVLAALSQRLFTAGILPYYLHLCDKTQGTAHFDVDEARAKDIMHSLRGLLPGYLVPRCVREIPGEVGKVTI